jgi:hypothetical protein
LVRLGRLDAAAGIPDSGGADVAIVVDQLEHMSRRGGAHLLARLRDVHCASVVLNLDNDVRDREELLAPGLMSGHCPSTDGRVYVFDPDKINEPREWNNPSDWANPGNFDKNRW